MIRRLQTLDLKCFLGIHRLSHLWRLNVIARAVSRTGDGWLYIVIMPLSILQLQPDAARPLILAALLGFGCERLIYFILKNTLKRPRPPEMIDNFRSWIVASDRFSLPSGHTSAAFFVATFLTVGVSPLFLTFYLWAIAVGLSRILLGVHFPGDVLAGGCLGSIVALLVLL